MTDNDNTIDSAAECDPTARGTELVYTTVENSRLLTLPATEIKYYLPDARDNWNADSDEVILLLQFFDNCLASGDARSLELARRAFNNLNEKDDEALLETLGFVLVRWLPDDELLAYLNTEDNPFFLRYQLVVAMGNETIHRSAEFRDAVYDMVKAQFKALLKIEPARSEKLYDAAMMLSELRDARAIPLLRRFAQNLKDALPDDGEDRNKFLAVLSILLALGAKIDDLHEMY
ncbi:MAG: hypothetical protein II184_09315 [Clostridia bacterium]|jgi:hypothetical protein|nr:hypothetical protein [Clostridia bacterium]MBQ3868161.1 hypothetical protein [Clostridia bacterium]